MAERIDTTPTKTIERVCVSPASKDQICLLCAKVITKKDFELTIYGQAKKTKACLNLELIVGKEISSDQGSHLTNILCRNCADKNETVLRKLHEVRERLESSTRISRGL